MKHITKLTAAFTICATVAFAQNGKPGAHFIENWDENGDGAVSLAEATERRSDVFATFDADDNGVLSATEYDLFDEARETDLRENGEGGGHGKMNPANGMKRKFTDANKDGEVTKAEFMASIPAWFARMDKNNDGQVTSRDFGKGH